MLVYAPSRLLIRVSLSLLDALNMVTGDELILLRAKLRFDHISTLVPLWVYAYRAVPHKRKKVVLMVTAVARPKSCVINSVGVEINRRWS